MQKLIRFFIIYILPGTLLGLVVSGLIPRDPGVQVLMLHEVYFLVWEDGPIQWLQFGFLLLTAFYCFRIVRNYRHYYTIKLIRNAFLMFSILSIFVAMEEISWGQRVLGIKTPQFIDEISTKNEITFHNLVYLERYSNRLTILFGMVGTLLILGRRWATRYVKDRAFIFFIPPSIFIWVFGLTLLSGIVLEMREIPPFHSYGRAYRLVISEVGEFLVAMTAFFYSAWKYEELIVSRTTEVN